MSSLHLVSQRQRHLKWRALDPLERVLMILCGILLFGFCTTVIFDIITREIRHPWLWLQEVTSTFFIYAIFIGAAVATRRNDHLYLTAIGDALHGRAAHDRRVATRLVVLGVALCFVYFGYLNFLRGFTQLPHAVDDADRLALCGDPVLRRADRAVHGRAARQRLAQRLRA